jgi:excisionase family DNA binding protein
LESKPWLTVKQVADALRVNTDTVYGWINYGHLPAVDISTQRRAGRPRWRVNPEELAEFLKRRQSGPPQPILRRRSLPPVRQIV